MTKRRQYFGGPPFGCSRVCIVVIVGVKASANLKVTRGDGSSANGIFMEKEDLEEGILLVYCYYWDSLLGIRIT